MSWMSRSHSRFQPSDQTTAALLMPKTVEPKTAVLSAIIQLASGGWSK